MKTRIASLRGSFFPTVLVFGAIGSFALLGVGCAHATPTEFHDAVVVDRSNPDQIVITLKGACEQQQQPVATSASVRAPAREMDMAYPFTTEDGKTYYFSSDSQRTRFIQAHDINSRY